MRDALGAGLAAAALAFAIVALAVGIDRGDDASQALAEGNDFGRAVFARMGCGSCHALAAAGSHGTIGPNLDARLKHHTRESLVAQITAPASSGGFTAMPTDFGSRMNAHELDELVRFLLAAR
ncbi:MAG TPA: c-type cytochrome [Thermoleophilaceae bacterium]|nr:c-type cytochrome [Thermoleophilaceae bacterium]